MPRKKTHEEFIEDLKNKRGEEYTVLGVYVGNRVKIKFRHNICNHEWETMPTNIFKLRGCPRCNGGVAKSNEDFVNELHELYKGEYISLTKYTNNSNKIEAQHKCGYKYKISPSKLLSGQKCAKCYGYMKGKDTAYFKSEVFDLVGDEYEVVGEYVNSQKYIKMKHNECGYEYNITPNSFTQGVRCPKCFGFTKKTTKQFKTEVYHLVKGEYEVIGEYNNALKHIKIKHNECGYEYLVTPANFLNGKRCAKCRFNALSKKLTKSHDAFLNQVYNLVGEEYEVFGEYSGAYNKIKIKHNKCNFIYEVAPVKFTNDNNRCPRCNQPKGEMEIERFLISNNIKFTNQYSFNKEGYKLYKYDFAVLDDSDNVKFLIEYDGEQHFKYVEFFHRTEENFNKYKERDDIKNKLAKDEGIPLIRIRYDENIPEKLYNTL